MTATPSTDLAFTARMSLAHGRHFGLLCFEEGWKRKREQRLTCGACSELQPLLNRAPPRLFHFHFVVPQRLGRSPLRYHDDCVRGSNGQRVLCRWMYCSQTVVALRALLACRWIPNASIFTLIHIFPASMLGFHASCHGALIVVGSCDPRPALPFSSSISVSSPFRLTFV
jgi:hypothetical protein